MPSCFQHLPTPMTISSVWRSLVASCVCLKFERSFWTYLCPTPKSVHFQCETCLSPTQNAFVCSVLSNSEVSNRDYLIAINTFIYYMEDGLETPQKRKESRRKKFLKKRRFKQGRTGRKFRKKVEMKECKNTSLHLLCFCRYRVVFLCSFISVLFLYFFRSIPTGNEVFQKLFTLVLWKIILQVICMCCGHLPTSISIYYF